MEMITVLTIPSAAATHVGGANRCAARPSLERALAEYERLDIPFEAARTREHVANALPAKERAPVLAAALGQYERLGATPSVQRVCSAAVAAHSPQH
jgi:hypothetical protein